MITSKIDTIKLEGDCLLVDWKTSGLLHKSLLRLSKIATVESTIAEKKMGSITQRDTKQVSKEIIKLFKHWK